MIAARDFNLISGFCIDDMHCVFLGLTRKHLDLWLNSNNHKESFYIKPKCQKVLNQRIQNLKPTSEITRKPRSIFDRADFKANELRSLLFYYLPFSLNGLLKKCYVDHFKLLSSAIYMLSEECIPMNNVELSEKKLIEYADKFENLYGQHNVTLNLHLVRHVATAVRHLGPLWAQSAFGMEANNGVLTKNTAKKNVLHSITWRYITKSELIIKQETNKNEINVGGKQTIIMKQNEIDKLSPFGFKAPRQAIFKIISINGKKYTSKKAKEVASADFFIKLKNSRLGINQFYFVHDFTVYGLLEVYETIECIEQFQIVKPTGLLEVFKVKDIERKLIYMNITNLEIITSIPNRFEKT